MKPQNLLEAIQLLTDNHSNEIIINHVPNGHVSTSKENPTLHIKNCVPAVVKKLMDAGFNLSMENGLMSVDDFAKK